MDREYRYSLWRPFLPIVSFLLSLLAESQPKDEQRLSAGLARMNTYTPYPPCEVYDRKSKEQ